MEQCIFVSVQGAVYHGSHLIHRAYHQGSTAGREDFSDGRFLELCRFAAIGLDLESEEVSANAGNDIGNARRPVHTAMFFPTEAPRHGLKVAKSFGVERVKRHRYPKKD